MTYYHGGKKRIGKEIAEIIDSVVQIVEGNNFKVKGYCEPFIGMAGVYQHIPRLFGDIKYKAGDVNIDLIELWKAVRSGWNPPTKCSKTEYDRLKGSKASPKRTFLGYACDFRGILFSAYDKRKNVKWQAEKLTDLADTLSMVSFRAGNYAQFSNLRNFVIYCDPPYDETEQRYGADKFDSKEFFKWCRLMARENIVFVSEFDAPADFILISEIGKERLYVAFP